MDMAKYRITWMPGDGIGNDVMGSSTPCVATRCPQLSARIDAMCGDEVPAAQRQEIRDAIGQLPKISARRFMELLAFRG
ncbi:MAG: isocitrate/isopropylmalate dehydrogenase [Candidatus Paceibacteria bacterium]|jgi:isocitrate/isopropylmalate dehydrogenase